MAYWFIEVNGWDEEFINIAEGNYALPDEQNIYNRTANAVVDEIVVGHSRRWLYTYSFEVGCFVKRKPGDLTVCTVLNDELPPSNFSKMTRKCLRWKRLRGCAFPATWDEWLRC